MLLFLLVFVNYLLCAYLLWFLEMYQKLKEKKASQLKLKLTAEDINACNIADTSVSCILSFLESDETQSPNTSKSETCDYLVSLGYA